MDTGSGGQEIFSVQAVELADQIHSAAIHLLRRLRMEDEASGLTAPRLSALSVVVFGGPIRISNLAAAEQVRPPTISRLVTELEREGLVRRRPDAADGRIQRVVATAKGRRVLEQGRRRRVARLAADLARLPSQQLQILSKAAELLERLSRVTAKKSGERRKPASGRSSS